mgnify:CR=1 FL=1
MKRSTKRIIAFLLLGAFSTTSSSLHAIVGAKHPVSKRFDMSQTLSTIPFRPIQLETPLKKGMGERVYNWRMNDFKIQNAQRKNSFSDNWFVRGVTSAYEWITSPLDKIETWLTNKVQFYVMSGVIKAIHAGEKKYLGFDLEQTAQMLPDDMTQLIDTGEKQAAMLATMLLTYYPLQFFHDFFQNKIIKFIVTENHDKFLIGDDAKGNSIEKEFELEQQITFDQIDRSTKIEDDKKEQKKFKSSCALFKKYFFKQIFMLLPFEDKEAAYEKTSNGVNLARSGLGFVKGLFDIADKFTSTIALTYELIQKKHEISRIHKICNLVQILFNFCEGSLAIIDTINSFRTAGNAVDTFRGKDKETGYTERRAYEKKWDKKSWKSNLLSTFRAVKTMKDKLLPKFGIFYSAAQSAVTQPRNMKEKAQFMGKVDAGSRLAIGLVRGKDISPEQMEAFMSPEQKAMLGMAGNQQQPPISPGGPAGMPQQFSPEQSAAIKQELAKLSPEKRKEAEAMLSNPAMMQQMMAG